MDASDIIFIGSRNIIFALLSTAGDLYQEWEKGAGGGKRVMGLGDRQGLGCLQGKLIPGVQLPCRPQKRSVFIERHTLDAAGMAVS